MIAATFLILWKCGIFDSEVSSTQRAPVSSPRPNDLFPNGIHPIDQKQPNPGIRLPIDKEMFWICSVGCQSIYKSQFINKPALDNFVARVRRKKDHRKYCVVCWGFNKVKSCGGLGGECLSLDSSDECGVWGDAKRKGQITKIVKPGTTAKNLSSLKGCK